MHQKPIWSPDKIENTRWYQFQSLWEKNLGREFESPHDFQRSTVEHLELFWKTLLSHSKLPIAQKETDPVLMQGKRFQDAVWFPNAKGNLAECLLHKGQDHDLALIYRSELGEEERYTFGELKREVLGFQNFLKILGIKKGDVICGLVPNHPCSTIAMLATTSLGAIWSSASPDFGAKGVLDRFSQIKPKLLVSVPSVSFKGKPIDLVPKINEIVETLNQDPGFKGCFLFSEKTSPNLSNKVKFYSYPDLTFHDSPLSFVPITFQDPVYIMFSSGTTGLPKCIVQGLGVLLLHWKELALHSNLSQGDKLFYYTTCGWMMWNWTQSALSLGATVLQFEGSPFYPGPNVLWEFAEQEKVNVFGTSAKYLSVLEEQNYFPNEEYPLSSLRTLLSTGSPLFPSQFDFVYQSIKQDLHLASISGGTDLNGCFALGYPTLPVYRGEIQGIGLGMDVQIWNEDGKPVVKTKGELVCKSPFPSMPLEFWNDPSGEKYESAYFSRFPGVWCHGDFAEILENKGLIIYGRSDATLNPGGVRIGTADIYSVLESIPEIVDSVVIGQEFLQDVRIVLFVKLLEGMDLSEALVARIKNHIRESTSPRHVPALVVLVPDIPYTINGKKVEIAVKQAIEKKEIKNKNALSNPESLAFFENLSLPA